jgi:competence protein ComEC
LIRKKQDYPLKNVVKGKENSVWKTAPFLKLLIPFVAGIVIEKYFHLEPIFIIPVFFLSVLVVILCNFFSPQRFFGIDWMAGVAIQFAIFSFGRLVMYVHQDTTVEKSSCFSKNRSNLLLLRLLSDPVTKPKSWKAEAKIIGLVKDQRCFVENEKILVYFDINLDAGQVSSGSIIVTRKKLQPIQNIRTADFDYIGYCHLRHIYGQLYLKENDFGVIGREQEKAIFSTLDRFRKKLVIILKNQIPCKSKNGFLEALLFGYTVDLDPSLMKSYANTGVVHIIAISGLHLTLICQLLQVGFLKFGRRKSLKWPKFILIAGILWAYSLFSGASPSVIRAATMFSLVLFARDMLRQSVLFNTLASSAFLLLCFDPGWLWDTGFQLSYAAVLGLGLFSTRLQGLIQVRNKILQAVWKATAVSIAAQVFTTPLSIYYFHQFPVYFLFANLLAVPLSSAILVGGILLCIFYPIRPLADLLGWGLGLGVEVLNRTIHYFSKLPGAVISQLTINLPQLFSIYFILFCFYQFLKMKEKSWFLAALSGIVVFQVSRFL